MHSKFNGGGELRKHWLLDDQMHFLNHGSFGACPREVLAAQQEWRERMEHRPINFLVRELPGLIRSSAAELAAFLGTDANDLAFVENATAAVNAIIRSYPWQSGDEILMSCHAYPAVKNAVRFVAMQFHLTVREFSFSFPLQDTDEIVQSFTASIGQKTRLAIIDHVSSPLAIIYPLEKLLAVCRWHGVKSLVDGAHAPGMIPLNIQQLNADWYVGNCHKWLFAPKGCAFVWAAKQVQPYLQPTVISLRMDEGYPLSFDWVGTRDASAWLSITAALGFYQSVGGDEIPKQLHKFVIDMAQMLAADWGVELPAPSEQFAAMVTLPLPIPGKWNQGMANQLRDSVWQRYQIEVPLFVLNEDQIWCRISAQLYNKEAEYKALSVAINQLI